MAISRISIADEEIRRREYNLGDGSHTIIKEKLMRIADSILPEFDHEMATTRKMLERFPEDKVEWRPHETSMTLGRLAGHVSELAGWTVATMGQDKLEMDPNRYKPNVITSRAEALKQFDEIVASARAAIAAASDETMMRPWTFVAGGRTVFTMPKIAVLRSFVMNHLIHHRGQLSVFYRIAGVPVPSLYGPSKDEQMF
jgi:uncharacterized damage-inducible protein DinB